MSDLMLLILLPLVGLNVFATVVVLRARELTTAQRLLQTLLVWAVPVVGAVAVLGILAADRSTQGAASAGDPVYGGDEASLSDAPSLCGCSSAGGGDD